MNRSPYNSNTNRSPSNSLPLRKAIIGFLNFKTAEGLSQRSVASYQRILEQWADYAEDKKVSQFTDHDINSYLVYMRTEYVPRRFGGDTRAEREDGEDPNAPPFVVRRQRGFSPDALRHLIKSIAAKAGVKKAYPHRFRHTFAITYLRSGGDVFTLQTLLGHGSLDMVRHYARIAQMDVEQAHRKASPVDNWRLFRFLEGPYADPFNNGLYPDVITLANSALVDIDKMATEEIYYWRGMAKANLEDWDGAAQDLRRAHLLNPNFLPAGKELRRMNSLGLTPSLDVSQELTVLALGQRSSFTSYACSAIYNGSSCQS
ncbi:MAG TPA: tyrosine-type recombinase/integrase [Anaerolineales bacterium]|nr:tyrosine-type recombinase/integrase [Anaerolineales bacterium]